LEFQTFEAVSALVAVLDIEDRIVYWNHSCSDLTGYSLDEIRGRTLWNTVLAPEEVDSERAVFATLRTALLPTASANYWISKTGQRRWVAWSHSLARTPEGQIRYIIKTGIDQTERKEAEDARRANEAKLGALAVENARLYENSQRAADDLLEANQHMVQATIQAQELTEKAEVALRRAEAIERQLHAVAEFREMFIGILGHDLRNPIGAISMSAETLLRRGHLDVDDRSAAMRILASSERVTRMIFQLLELTRARLGGGFPLEPQPTDLGEVCRSVAEEFDPPLQLEVEGNMSGVWDPDRLAEALANIARNATEHAAPGTAVVVKARAEDAEVVVEIVNRGEPIPADLLPFIFEPFRRAQQNRTSATGNLGLGLYIANQIVGSGGGKLVAYSADGTTTFAIRLPRQPPGGSHLQGTPPVENDDQAASRPVSAQ
jgi:PAS domain S-box-containing protein